MKILKLRVIYNLSKISKVPTPHPHICFIWRQKGRNKRKLQHRFYLGTYMIWKADCTPSLDIFSTLSSYQVFITRAFTLRTVNFRHAFLRPLSISILSMTLQIPFNFNGEGSDINYEYLGMVVTSLIPALWGLR